YLGLFRRQLAFPRALLLYPIGLLASAAFNVLRIAALMVIGLEIDPNLAVGAFHSHAGWLMFTLVAVGLVMAARATPVFDRALPTGPNAGRGDAPLPPFRRDPEVARLLPFAVFMASAVLASALADPAGMAYPMRAAMMGAAVMLVWPALAALPWRMPSRAALEAVAIGAAVGALWLAVPADPPEVAPYGSLVGIALIGWFVARAVGTVVLVPLIEEAFFRDYLERKLQRGPGVAWTALSVGVSAAAFAALHDRWWLAALAALAFSLVRRRSGRLADAILAHAIANALVFGGAAASGNLGLI
ncbi:MAG: exosortase E/protease, VPEID-CTERM system, partial [Shimia sp.]